jgi:hypothetical protein
MPNRADVDMRLRAFKYCFRHDNLSLAYNLRSSLPWHSSAERRSGPGRAGLGPPICPKPSRVHCHGAEMPSKPLPRSYPSGFGPKQTDGAVGTSWAIVRNITWPWRCCSTPAPHSCSSACGRQRHLMPIRVPAPDQQRALPAIGGNSRIIREIGTFGKSQPMPSRRGAGSACARRIRQTIQPPRIWRARSCGTGS